MTTDTRILVVDSVVVFRKRQEWAKEVRKNKSGCTWAGHYERDVAFLLRRLERALAEEEY